MATAVDIEGVINRLGNEVAALTVQRAMLEETNAALQSRVIELEAMVGTENADAPAEG